MPEAFRLRCIGIECISARPGRRRYHANDLTSASGAKYNIQYSVSTTLGFFGGSVRPTFSG